MYFDSYWRSLIVRVHTRQEALSGPEGDVPPDDYFHGVMSFTLGK